MAGNIIRVQQRQPVLMITAKQFIKMHCKNIRKTTPFTFQQNCSKFILDVDTGCDDAQFILLMIHLAKRFGKEIIGITCVDGNAELQNVVTNTLICIKMCDAKIPVYKGAKSNIQGYTAKDNYFGTDGLNSHQPKYSTILGPEEYALVQKQSAFLFISQSAEKYGKDLAIIATGPLTNIAISYLLNNQIPNLIGGFTIMGGSYSGVGLNHMFSAEFNFHGDVDAAHLVLKNFKNIIVIPLELALQAPTVRNKEFFKCERTPKGLFVKDLFTDMFNTLCDPLAAFPMLMPKTVTGMYYVYGEVCREGARTKGFLAIDWLKMKGSNEPNLQIICHLDWDLVFNTMVESLE